MNLLSKLYQSTIARDQLVKLFVERLGIVFKSHSSVRGYEDFENQINALQHSRAYRKIAMKAEKYGRQQPEKFFYKNFGTRDLLDLSVSQSNGVEVSKASLSIRFDALIASLRKISIELPPPLKSSLIPDINLSARLLPSPILTSA